ncbi:MAG: hypothetical protein LBC80_10135 [Treponema sp.]|jgi:hypothetical protein|nr:hypothetical protein [Treponema sp.]
MKTTLSKKLFLFFVILFIAVNIQAEEYQTEENRTGGFRMGNRTFEIGILNVDGGFANNYFGSSEIFTNKLKLNTNYLANGLKFSLDMNVRPLFFNVNIKDNWGFGLDFANITAYGNIDISGELLSLKKPANETFGAGASAFADIGIPVFFHLRDIIWERDLKITFRPAFYTPLVFTKPNMRYYFDDKDGGSLLKLDIGAKVFTPFSLDNNASGMNTSIGFDFSIGAEYPLYSWIDVGVNIINFPFLSSKLTHCMVIDESLWLDTSKIDVSDVINGKVKLEDVEFHNLDDFELDPSYISANRKTFRPFKMVFHANYRPLETQLLTLIPTLGFSVNPVFVRTGSIETGIKARCDLANLFITTVGIVYEDQLWKNGIDFILNLRAMELGFGISMQSQRFGKSWTAAGLRANFGLKFGY